VVGIISNTVPWELLRAAGMFPVMLNAPPGRAPLAARFMEDGVFSARIRGIVDGLASGAWPFLKQVVIPRTSEQEHKLYLYLREMARQGWGNALPNLYLYNLLHARSPEAETYGFDRTQELKNYLERSAGRSIEPADLACAIDESNSASQAIARLLSLRAGPEPRLTGTEALPLIGAAYFMDRVGYAPLALDAAGEISRRPPARGVRLLIKGSPLHHTGLHRAIESHEAVVVAEDDWWGSRAFAEQIAASDDHIRSIFETYYRSVPSPRVFPRELRDQWLFAAAAAVDGVLFYLPPEDDVLGWDHPRFRHSLEQHGIRTLLIREDAAEALSSECHQRIEDFVSSLSRRN
jgi:benzoyl-CoA reductase/2-hydroxyglutaryl-CoA dehydratase subunit BcrC/BadD/HgdB